MFVDSYGMELIISGRCASRLTEAECKTGPYPKSSYKWVNAITDSSLPTGCYARKKKRKYTSKVYFNRAVDGTDCTSKRKCLCKKGIAVLSIYLFESKN